jgi:Domain of unknown function (DUF4331)
MTRTLLKSALAAAVVAAPLAVFTANHREAPITALDRAADITDWYSFVSYDDPSKLTMILSVDPLLEPANGPNYFPFDPDILYEMRVDNDQDAVEDVILQFRFQTEQRNPGVFTGFVGGLLGIPPVTALDGAGSEGLGFRQSYTVTAIRGNQRFDLSGGRKLFAVPTNVGPRTMPTYQGLYDQGIYDLGNGIRVFAGTTDDPFYIDLGAAFDSLNFRTEAGGGVLSQADDDNNAVNVAADDVSGFNVNTIAIEVPIRFLTRDLRPHTDSEPAAVLGTYGTTSRPQITIRRRPREGRGNLNSPTYRQVQRMGNPLINELIIGTGSKDRFSIDDPTNDGQFVSFFAQPLLADIFKSIGVPVPAGPRTDLALLVQYTGPTIPAATRKGPVADLLRVNTGIPATAAALQQRLGLLTLLDGNAANDDAAGFPNGRRPDDDVTDIAARAVAGILVNPATFGTRIGDGVNVNDMPKRTTFPYIPPAHDGRNSRHVDPSETGCAGVCPPGL